MRVARVLVLDDQEPIRRLTRRVLENEGHEVWEAADGELGMALLERAAQPVDLVITDIFMPGMDGIQALREIRKRFPAIKVIAMSGGDSTGLLDLRKDAELLGAVKSLHKPFTARDIVEVVRSVLSG